VATISVHGVPVEIDADTTVAKLKAAFDHLEGDIAVCWSDDGALLLKDHDRVLDHMSAGDELWFQPVEPGDGLFSE
jgi:hypothetical protein